MISSRAARPLITSVSVHLGPGHDRVRVWNRGGLAGELTVECGDGVATAALLLPIHVREQDDGETGRPDWTFRAIDPDELAEGLDSLRILSVPICHRCWTSDGELVLAVHLQDHHGFARSEWECQPCADREPSDQGEDDGPLTMAQRADVAARDDWRML